MFERRQSVLQAIDFGHETGVDNERAALGVRHHVMVCLGRVARIEGDADDVRDGCAEEEVGGLDRVYFEACDAVAGLEAERQERVRHPQTARPGLGEGQTDVAVDDRLAMGVVLRCAAHRAADVDRRLP